MSALFFSRSLATTLFFLLSSAPLSMARQCSSKPPIPAAGLSTTVTVNQSVSYSDGYRTEGYLVYPTMTPPACGWPLVVYVHGFPGSKDHVLAPSTDLASRGFAVWAYDVRGQGSAIGLNAPGTGFTFNGPDEKADLAEEIAFVRATFAGLVHPSLVAVTGTSQGAITSWFAAAASETTIHAPGRGAIAFPKIAAVAPHAAIADVHEGQLLQGTAFLTQFAANLFANAKLYKAKSSLMSTWQSYFLADDPAGLWAAWQAEPNRLWGDALRTSTVPVLWNHAYLDANSPALYGLERFESMPASTPARAILSTGGHSSPDNDYESEFRLEQRVRWFDHFLWGIPDGVDQEARFVRAAMPLDLTQLLDPTLPWGHRYDDALPPADLAPLRVYLTDGGALDPTAPAVPGTPTVIQHRVALGYTPSVWASSPVMRSLSMITANMPLSTRTFTLAPLTEERELAGRVPISLAVTPNASRFQLNAQLSARIPGATADFAISAISKGVLAAQPGVPMRLDFVLPTAVCVLPAGTVLKLTLRNHWIDDAPMPSSSSTVTVPYFTSCDLSIAHGTGVSASTIDLPFLSSVRVALTTPHVALDTAFPQTISFQVTGGQARQSDFYAILVGASGQAPGVTVGGVNFALNPDALTSAGYRQAAAAPPWYTGFLGNLSPTGTASAVLDCTVHPTLFTSLAGTRMTFVTWSQDALGKNTASNPVDLILR